MVWSLFIIDLMGLFFYTKIGSIISIGDLPTTNIIEPKESGDKPDSFFVCKFSPRLHDTEETSCDTNYKEGKNDCDWRYFFLKQPHAKESKEKSHQSWDQ